MGVLASEEEDAPVGLDDDAEELYEWNKEVVVEEGQKRIASSTRWTAVRAPFSFGHLLVHQVRRRLRPAGWLVQRRRKHPDGRSISTLEAPEGGCTLISQESVVN